MRSLLELSARRDTTVELADWVEISAFFRDDRSISKEDLVRALVREGESRSEQPARDKATEAFDELAARAPAIGNSIDDCPLAFYPFQIDGDLLRLIVDPFAENHAGLLYAFLLTITRASMDSSSRKLNNLDPTLLFEEVCAEALCQFWGGRTALSDVFVAGTSNKSASESGRRYQRLIENLARHLCEGGGWKESANSPGAGDGGLDLAVWRRFHDRRPGGLVGFAQCKTGDLWRNHLGRKNPASISEAYFRTPLVLPPLPIYMVPCRVGLDEWVQRMREHSGVLFDRCRITTFGTRLSKKQIVSCESWLRAAINRERQFLIKKGILADSESGGATS